MHDTIAMYHGIKACKKNQSHFFRTGCTHHVSVLRKHTQCKNWHLFTPMQLMHSEELRRDRHTVGQLRVNPIRPLRTKRGVHKMHLLHSVPNLKFMQRDDHNASRNAKTQYDIVVAHDVQIHFPYFILLISEGLTKIHHFYDLTPYCTFSHFLHKSTSTDECLNHDQWSPN